MAAPIDAPITKFASAVNDALTAHRTKALKDAKPGTTVPDLKVKVSNSAVTKIRTPKEQADQIVGGKSWTCSSAHMTENARHVDLFKDGKYVQAPTKELSAAEHKVFADAWTAAMSANGLLNYKGKAGYDEGDAYHLELPDTKLPFDDKRVQECLGHYAKMTRQEGKAKNAKFEADAKIKKYLEDYEKKTVKK